jgi:hypothetical protein
MAALWENRPEFVNVPPEEIEASGWGYPALVVAVVLGLMLAIAAIIWLIVLDTKDNWTVDGSLHVTGDTTLQGNVSVEAPSDTSGTAQLKVGIIRQLGSTLPLRAWAPVVVDAIGTGLTTPAIGGASLVYVNPTLYVSDSGLDDLRSGFDIFQPLRSVSAALERLCEINASVIHPGWTGDAKVVLLGASFSPSPSTSEWASTEGSVIITSELGLQTLVGAPTVLSSSTDSESGLVSLQLSGTLPPGLRFVAWGELAPLPVAVTGASTVLLCYSHDAPLPGTVLVLLGEPSCTVRLPLILQIKGIETRALLFSPNTPTSTLTLADAQLGRGTIVLDQSVQIPSNLLQSLELRGTACAIHDAIIFGTMQVICQQLQCNTSLLDAIQLTCTRSRLNMISCLLGVSGGAEVVIEMGSQVYARYSAFYAPAATSTLQLSGASEANLAGCQLVCSPGVAATSLNSASHCALSECSWTSPMITELHEGSSLSADVLLPLGPTPGSGDVVAVVGLACALRLSKIVMGSNGSTPMVQIASNAATTLSPAASATVAVMVNANTAAAAATIMYSTF